MRAAVEREDADPLNAEQHRIIELVAMGMPSPEDFLSADPIRRVRQVRVLEREGLVTHDEAEALLR